MRKRALILRLPNPHRLLRFVPKRLRSRGAMAGLAGVVIVLLLTLVITTSVIAPIGPITKTIGAKTKQVLGIKPPETTKTVATPITANPYGIAAGSSLTSLSDSELEARMAGIQALGVSWIRFDVDWSLVQPQSKSEYSWAGYDRLYASAKAHGLSVLGILDYTPSWARSGNCGSAQCAPSDLGAFAQFAAAAATRYKDQGAHSWEIWNEPNNPQFWQPSADVGQYTALLKQAYGAIHAADPNAVVITAGLSPQADSGNSLSPVSFVKQLYADGAQGSFDAVADHPYTFPLTPASSGNHAWNQMAAGSNSIRALMVANGDSGKKIWITEFGSPTGGPGPVATPALDNLSQKPYVVNENLQANILSDALRLYKSYDWVGPFMYYSYQDAGTSNDTNENFFGLVDTTGRKKPAYDVYYNAIHQ